MEDKYFKIGRPIKYWKDSQGATHGVCELHNIDFTVEAPGEPCPECADLLKEALILIEKAGVPYELAERRRKWLKNFE